MLTNGSLEDSLFPGELKASGVIKLRLTPSSPPETCTNVLFEEEDPPVVLCLIFRSLIMSFSPPSFS